MIQGCEHALAASEWNDGGEGIRCGYRGVSHQVELDILLALGAGPLAQVQLTGVGRRGVAHA